MSPDAFPDGLGEGDEEVSAEAQRPARVAGPTAPSRQEQEEHELLGCVQYRSWCKHRVASRGLGQAHHPAPPDEERALPVVSPDYCFMSQEEEDVHPILVIKDRKSKAHGADSAG